MYCAFRSGVPKKGQAKVLYGLDREFPAVAVVNLGPDPKQETKKYATDSQLENRDLVKENLRCGIAGIVRSLLRFTFAFFMVFINVAAGVKALRDSGVEVISIDPCSDPECAAESAALTRWKFQELKNVNKRQREVDLVLHGTSEAQYLPQFILLDSTFQSC